jgi:anti-anti-sigma factor
VKRTSPPSRGWTALTAQVSGQAVQLTIDAANLRYADSASMRTLVMAAMKARTRAGSVTLLDPQPPVARMLDLLCVDEMLSIRHRATGETHIPGSCVLASTLALRGGLSHR